VRFALSTALTERLADDFDALGLNLLAFYVTSISPTEETTRAIDERAAMDAIGDTNIYMKFKAARANRRQPHPRADSKARPALLQRRSEPGDLQPPDEEMGEPAEGDGGVNEFVISNDLLANPQALRERAQEEGYLFFRGMIDREAIRSVRRQILERCAQAGWLRPGTDVREGIAAPGVAYVEPEPAYMAVYNQVMKMEDFHALAHQPALLHMFDALFDEPTLVHPRNIARIIFPQNVKYTTPAHQDFIHVQGAEETWTAWIPLGDCPRDLGSLALLPGSHRGGVYPVHSAYGAGGLGIDTDRLPHEWAASDFALGDVVVFHSLTVHKGLPNLSPDRIRLSVDYRYQGVSRPITQGSLLPHFAQVTWEEAYANWKSDRYQYYWKDLPLNVVDWTPKYRQSAREGH